MIRSVSIPRERERGRRRGIFVRFQLQSSPEYPLPSSRLSGRSSRIELNYRLSITTIYRAASLPVSEATTTVYEFTVG